MACIDKIYVKTKDQALEFIDWCFGRFVTDKYGNKESLLNWCIPKHQIEGVDWSNDSDYPVYNGSVGADFYLIQNCPFDYIQDRLKLIYGSDYDSIKDGTYKSEISNCDFPVGRHFRIFKMTPSEIKSLFSEDFIQENMDICVPVDKMLNKVISNKYWQVSIYKNKVTELSDYLRFLGYNGHNSYHSYTDNKGNTRFYRTPIKIGSWDQIGEEVKCDYWSDCCEDCKTIRALTRCITKKWNLPVGTELIVTRMNFDAFYKIIIKK